MENLSSRINTASELVNKENSIPIIYIAGAYRGDGQQSTHYLNVEKAESAAYMLSINGFGYFCPHSNGALATYVSRNIPDIDGYNEFQSPERHEINMSICRRLIMSCDAMLMIEGWHNSAGAKEEHDLAKLYNIPIYYTLEELMEAKNTYFSYPKQFNLLRAIQTVQFQLHREKNLDYSPYNVKATGKLGLVTRIWDKMARIMKLTGFNIGTGKYEKPLSPKNESVVDSFVDMSNYSLFYLIIDRDLWGI